MSIVAHGAGGFCSVKQMRVFDYPLDGTLIHGKLASQQMLVLIYLPRKDGKLS